MKYSSYINEQKKVMTPRQIANMITKTYGGKKTMGGSNDITMRMAKGKAKALAKDLKSQGWTIDSGYNSSATFIPLTKDFRLVLIDLSYGTVSVPKNAGPTDYRPVQD